MTSDSRVIKTADKIEKASDLAGRESRPPRGIMRWLTELAKFPPPGYFGTYVVLNQPLGPQRWKNLIESKAAPKSLQKKVSNWFDKNGTNVLQIMGQSSKPIQQALLWYLGLVNELNLRTEILRVAFDSEDLDLLADACYALWETGTDGTEFLPKIEQLLCSLNSRARSNALRALAVCRISQSRRIALVEPFVDSAPYDVIEALRPIRRWKSKETAILERLMMQTFGVRQATLDLIRHAEVPRRFLLGILVECVHDPDWQVVRDALDVIISLGDRAAPIVENIQDAADDARYRYKMFRETLGHLRRVCKASGRVKIRGRRLFFRFVYLR